MDAHDLDLLWAHTLHGHAPAPNDPLGTPIVPTSMYHLPGDPAGAHQYGRWSNPTWDALERALTSLEGADAVIFPSGMAAVAAVFFATLRAGDRVLLPADGYYTTRALAEKFLAPLAVQVASCATAEFDRADLSGYRLVWIESPSNPMLELADIAAVAQRAHAAGALVAVDNTTASPLGQRPLELGADLVVVSDTKSVAGHSDVLLGHVATTRPELAAAVRDWRKMAGAIVGPFEAWQVLRGLQTFEVRFERMCASAQTLATRLQSHAKVRAVRYPGLGTHPANALAHTQMRRFGHLLGVTLTNKTAAEKFLSSCHLVRQATSFGGVHTSAERRARWGDAVADGFIRLSVGCEPIEPLWRDLASALDSVPASATE